ncbi:hypothetical protein Droror1_Dr00023954 [Drosera rotundifolia]
MSLRFNLSNPTDVYDPLVEEAWTGNNLEELHELTSIAKSLEIPIIYAAKPTAVVVIRADGAYGNVKSSIVLFHTFCGLYCYHFPIFFSWARTRESKRRCACWT